MKIVGKVPRDYYDCISSMGVDKTQVLVRNPVEVVLDKELSHNLIEYYKDSYFWYLSGARQKRDYNRHVIFFCGNIYVITSKRGDVKPISNEELDKLSYSRTFWRTEVKISTATIDYLKELSHELKAPYLVIKTTEDSYAWNVEGVVACTFPVLQDYNFQTVVDPYTAYQEIQQYYFGVLGGHDKELTEIEDKYKLEGKGFDSKYGFRTRPKEEK